METGPARTKPVKPDVLYHFSEDPNIHRFAPHVPRTNPTHPPAVWAIDADHAPLYWFPRDCPRVTIWPRRPEDDGTLFQERLATVAMRGEFDFSLVRMHNAQPRHAP
jgi:hypothetical protein